MRFCNGLSLVKIPSLLLLKIDSPVTDKQVIVITSFSNLDLPFLQEVYTPNINALHATFQP